jgi:hypothetical protein
MIFLIGQVSCSKGLAHRVDARRDHNGCGSFAPPNDSFRIRAACQRITRHAQGLRKSLHTAEWPVGESLIEQDRFLIFAICRLARAEGQLAYHKLVWKPLKRGEGGIAKAKARKA